MPASLEIPADNRASRMRRRQQRRQHAILGAERQLRFRQRARTRRPCSAPCAAALRQRQFDHLRDKTVQVTSEAKARPIITALTMISADRNIDQGDNSCSAATVDFNALALLPSDRLRRRVRGRWRRCGLSGHGRRRNSRRLRGCGRRCGQTGGGEVTAPCGAAGTAWAAAPRARAARARPAQGLQHD